MNILQPFIHYLKQLSLFQLFLLFMIENGILIFVSVGIGYLSDGSIKKISVKISRKELWWTFSTLIINTGITLVGFILFKEGFIKMSMNVGPFRVLFDIIVLIIGMDFLLYIFHFLIHNIPIISNIHSLHHEYENPTPISLFVLNPLEVVGFGFLWLVLITVYQSSMMAVFFYLFLNIVMGIIGHLELEVIPSSWSKNIFFKWIANTRFHKDHHKFHNRNFGFYTSVWDKIFGTIE